MFPLPYLYSTAASTPSLNGILERQLDEVVDVGLPERIGDDLEAERSHSLGTVNEGHRSGRPVRVVPLGPREQSEVVRVVGVALRHKVDEVVD
jgi:hypothetical protein